MLAKPYFDPAGLIVATEEPSGQIVGFVHVGFGPNETLDGLDREEGTICMLIVHPQDNRPAIAAELLRRGEDYLRRAGAGRIYASGLQAIDPFYVGLYCGSELPGLLNSEVVAQRFFRRHDYQDADTVAVYQCDPAAFRPIVDRTQMQIRRNTTVELIEDAPSRNWWEACTLGCFQQIRSELRARDNGELLAAARLWCRDPFGQSLGVHALGLLDIEVVAERRQAGLATYLLGESIRRLHERGFTLIEGHAKRSNRAAIRLIEKLGFVESDEGTVLSKASTLEG